MAVEMLRLDERHRIEVLLPDRVDEKAPLLILAHGSSNDMRSPFMETISGRIGENGINVIRFNFPYKTAGRENPDRSEVLEDSWRKVIEWTTSNVRHGGLYIGGKSLGCRVATTVAGDYPKLNGMVFLGYPLHSPGNFEDIHDEYLTLLRLPMVFVHGTRDAFARMDLLQQALSPLRDWVTLHWIEGGDHSFKILIHPGHSYPETLLKVADLVSGWVTAESRKK